MEAGCREVGWKSGWDGRSWRIERYALGAGVTDLAAVRPSESWRRSPECGITVAYVADDRVRVRGMSERRYESAEEG
jgi:hypothetical protein